MFDCATHKVNVFVCERVRTPAYVAAHYSFFFLFPLVRPGRTSLCGCRLCGRKINKNTLIGRQTRFPLRRPSHRALIRGGCRSYEFMHMAEDVTDQRVQYLERLGLSK